MTRERDDTGQYVETVGLEDVIDVFESVRGPAITSSDVADALNCTTEAARQKLTRLYDRGVVDKRKSGRTMIYWRTDGGREPDVAPDPAPADPSPVEQTRPAEPTETRRDTVDDRLAEDVRAYIEEQDLPPKSEHGRDAVIDVFRQLRQHGTMGTGDLQEALYPDYEDYWAGPRAMWNAIDRYLEDIPGLEKAGYGEWGYTSDDDVRSTLEEE